MFVEYFYKLYFCNFNFKYLNMVFINNVMIVCYKLLVKLVNFWKENKLMNEIDRFFIELSFCCLCLFGCCCIYKECVVYKYKFFLLLGFDMIDEMDEFILFLEYVCQVLECKNKQKENIFCVIDEVCLFCVQVNYEVINFCCGCVVCSCYMNCFKDVICF